MLLATYTNSVKSYCDKQFFDRFNQLHDKRMVVDNSINGYVERLKELTDNVYHIAVPEEPRRTRFLRNVAESANFIRDKFLAGDYKYLIIVESDVIPPLNLVELFEKAITMADDNWGIIGGLYYRGFHNMTTGDYLEHTHHVLSGCTLYRRELIEEIPFRWSNDNLGAFPDAWICYDTKGRWSLYSYHNIMCSHLSKPGGSRGHEDL